MNLYLQCFLISLIGLGISVMTILKNLTNKAQLANVIFDWKLYFKTDLVYQLVGTLLTVGLFLMLLAPARVKYPALSNDNLVILLVFATTGYIGSDLASRLFSVVNTRINSAIDYKTTIADKASGNLGAPTPADKPTSQN